MERMRIAIGYFLFLAGISTLLLSSCANIVPPSGGPQDKTPPAVVRSFPENYSLHFNSETIRIDFDEFVQLNDVSNQVFISPRLSEKPDIKLKGRSLIIHLKETLNPDVTYTIYFGNAIGDLTENNRLTDFQYVFSTGAVLDSAFLTGRVADAFSREGTPDVPVMLYTEDRDSLPYIEEPYYVSRSGKEGYYKFSNLRNTPYKVFALKDVNANYLYDMPNEDIGFIKGMIQPESGPSGGSDSLASPVPGDGDHEVLLFREADTTQALLKAWLMNDKEVAMSFRMPVEELRIELLEGSEEKEWYFPEFSDNRDTVTLWITDPPGDSIHILVDLPGILTDTLHLPINRPSVGRQPRGTDKSAGKLAVLSNASMKFSPYDTLKLWFKAPLTFHNIESIQLLEEEDTIQPDIVLNGAIQREIVINHQWKENTTYTIIIPDSNFSDIRNTWNDSIATRFKTAAFTDYGDLTIGLTVTEPSGEYIIHLLAKGNKVIKQHTLSGSGEVGFLHMSPGDYRLRVIHDANANGKWDPGRYLEGIQPETVTYYQKSITIRSNWELRENWLLP